ncbi:DUF1428 domain-containing protein [Candidatus Micrarchaeota archaeon]|nr:DUF1428 domain-containing protein [Candidatus Micrarchaeota archaeon]
MTYVDGFVLVVPKKNVNAYKKMAELGKKIWMKHGALQYFECVGDDLNPNMGGMKFMPFPKLTKAKPTETVFFSFIIFKSRAHRDAVNKKVMSDSSMNDPTNGGKKMPFDMKRMSYGGFKTLVQK